MLKVLKTVVKLMMNIITEFGLNASTFITFTI